MFVFARNNFHIFSICRQQAFSAFRSLRISPSRPVNRGEQSICSRQLAVDSSRMTDSSSQLYNILTSHDYIDWMYSSCVLNQSASLSWQPACVCVRNDNHFARQFLAPQEGPPQGNSQGNITPYIEPI